MPVPTADARLVRAAALAGVAGPALLAAALVGLTLLEYDFMRSLGWHPTAAPTMDWPSGLALGPLGSLMTATFFLCGALLLLFARGLALALPGRAGAAGAALMAIAGTGMIGLCAPTDPTLTTVERTWHGLLHDASFALLGLALLPSMLLVARAATGRPVWRAAALAAPAVALAIGPAFLLKGALFYLFLALALAWFPLAARALWRSAARLSA